MIRCRAALHGMSAFMDSIDHYGQHDHKEKFGKKL